MPSPLGHDRGQSPARTVVDTAVRSGSDLLHRLRHSQDSEPQAVRVLTIGVGEGDLRSLWSDPDVLGRVLAEPYTGDPSRWQVDLVETVEDRVRFRARSGQDAPLTATGSVAFASAPQGLGTEVTLALELDGPDLAAGAAAHKALRRAKALAETGEIPTLAHNPSARHDPSGKDH